MKNFNLFALFFFLIIIISCSKNNSSPSSRSVFDIAKSNIWIQDSLYNTFNSDTSATFYNSDTSIRITFTDTSYTNRRTSTGSVTYYNASYEEPNKVYFWFPGEHMNPNEFLLIDFADDKKLITREIFDANNTQVIFYHSK